MTHFVIHLDLEDQVGSKVRYNLLQNTTDILSCNEVDAACPTSKPINDFQHLRGRGNIAIGQSSRCSRNGTCDPSVRDQDLMMNTIRMDYFMKHMWGAQHIAFPKVSVTLTVST